MLEGKDSQVPIRTAALFMSVIIGGAQCSDCEYGGLTELCIL